MIYKKFLKLIRSIDDKIYSYSKTLRIGFIYTNEIGLNCQYPVLVKILKDKNAVVTIIGADKPLLKDSRKQLAVDKYFVPIKFAKYYKYDFLITTDETHHYFKRNTRLIMIGHGAVFGNSNYTLYTQGLKKVDLIFGHSKDERSYIEKHQPEILDSKAFFPIGYPKSDELVNGSIDMERYYGNFNINRNRKTILIASHWTKVSILSTFDTKLISVLCKHFQDINIIQTAHEKIWDNPDHEGSIYDSIKLKQKINDLEKKYENFHFIPTPNVYPLLLMADIFITDHSSVMVEFSLLDRPIVFFDSPENNFYDSCVYQLYLAASEQFRSEKEIAKICESLLTNPSLNEEGRNKLKEYFFCNLGNSTDIFYNTLIELKFKS